MVVCHCHTISDKVIRREIEDGACCLDDVAARCGAGSRCGGCRVTVEKLLEQLRQPQPVA